MNDNTLDNPFWQYACALYKKPGVADTLLALQDKYDCNIPVLLLLIWLGNEGITISINDIERFKSAISELDSLVIKPIRAIRRYIKTSPALYPETYAELKALEQTIEQRIMALLYQQSLPIFCNPDATFCVERNLSLYILTGNDEQQQYVLILLEQIK